MVATQILTKMNNPEFMMDEVVDLIMMDQVLTAKMIRLVNSAFWGLSRKIESLREAFVYLGVKSVRNVVLSTAIVQMIPGSKEFTWLKSFWEHSFACALSSRLLSKSLGYKDSERAYLAGLLHDIGEIIIVQNFPKEFEKIAATAEQLQWDFHKAEMTVLGFSHVDFGPWLLEQWKVCGEIAHVVARHHNPETAAVDPALVAIVGLADLFCKTKGLSLGFKKTPAINWEEHPNWEIIKRELIGTSRFSPESHIKYLEDNIEEVEEFIQAIYD